MSPPKKKNMVVLHVVVPAELLARIERQRKKLERNGPAPMTAAVRMVLLHGLDALEGA
jgi:hypothetical protein